MSDTIMFLVALVWLIIGFLIVGMFFGVLVGFIICAIIELKNKRKLTREKSAKVIAMK